MKKYKVMMVAVLGIMVLLLSFAPMTTTAPSGVVEAEAGSNMSIGTEVVLSNNTVATYLGKTSDGNDKWQATFEGPKYLDDLKTPIEARWEYNLDKEEWNSCANLFTTTVKDSNVTVEYQGKKMDWQPQLEIGSKQQTEGLVNLLPVDPINENYPGNTLQWDYGNGITRNLRIIEGMLIEYYTISELPTGNITIKTNTNKDAGFVWTSPEVAWDANYKPVALTVDGDDLTLTLEAMQNATLPITIDPTSCFNTERQDVSLQITSDWHATQSGAWNEAHDASSALNMFTGYPVLIVQVSRCHSDDSGDYYYGIDRPVVYFDTSELPDNCIINEATLQLYEYEYGYDDALGSWKLQIQSGMPTYPHDPPRASDYRYTHYSGNGGRLYSSKMGGEGYKSITLTETGEGWINRAGTTKFMLRDGTYDIPDNIPSGTYSGDNYFGCYSYEKGANYRPRLIVYYETPPSRPEVSTNEATDIEYTSATLNGEITNTGGENCDERGFDWGETDSYGSTWTESGSYGAGSFSRLIAGLDHDKTYHFRAKAHNSAGWGYGTDKEIPKRLLPLERYAPVLYFHPYEKYYTDSFYSMLNESDLMFRWNNGSRELNLSGPVDQSQLPGPSTTGVYYLDMWNATPAPFLYNYTAELPDPDRFTGYRYTVYGRQVEKTYKGNDYIVLQYWFFYPYNNWWNCHEGDWERIQIILYEANETPQRMTFGQHWGGDTVPWAPANISFVSETHPKVFPARGSHASYPNNGDNGEHLLMRLGKQDLIDYTSYAGRVLFPGYISSGNITGVDKRPYTLTDITYEPSWVKWSGIWGYYVHGYKGKVGQSGCPGPANLSVNKINVWNNPIEWADDPGSSSIVGTAIGPVTGSVRLHAYDSQGNHTGLNETCGIETEIPGTYFYIPASNQSEAELMWIYTEENLTFTIEASEVGECNFSFARHFSDTVTTNYTHIEVTKNTTATVDTGEENPLLLMELDFDGDGVTDEYKFPDSNSTLKGQVNFTGRDTPPNDRWIEPFVVKLFEPGNLTNVLWTGVATTNNTGVFTIDNIPPGTYDIGIKNWTCLSELVTNVTVGANETTVVDFGTTREGDADGNDAVIAIDFSLLAGAFGSIPGDPNWNANCDFDRNDAITATDFSLLAGSFGQCGDLLQ